VYHPVQREIMGPLGHYHDVAVLDMHWMDESLYRQAYILHALNHVLRARDRILHHNQASALAASEGKAVDDELMRDQGFTRPRVLIVCPLRNVAKEIVEAASKLWQASGGTVENAKRFQEEYSRQKDDDDDDADGDNEDEVDPTKPADFNHKFRGNIDDCFRLGLKFTRKSMKIFSDFYSADVIIASPLGLRLVIDGEKEDAKTKQYRKKHGGQTKKREREGDSDFLSSIDILVVDGADTLLMQNWEHLEYVLGHLNGTPKDAHGCDFSRVQSIYLDGLIRNVRQNICLSPFAFPELNALLGNTEVMDNRLGRWKLDSVHSASVIKKSLPFVVPKFYQCPASSVASQAQERLDFFLAQVLPQYAAAADHVCIFVSTYFDFLQLKQHFTAHSPHTFTCLSEYDDAKAITGARSKFFNGHATFLLVTERFYFYRRPLIRGIKHLVFYSLPEHPEYFREWAGFVGDVYKKGEEALPRPPKTECPIVYSPLDCLKLERIVGSVKIDDLI
jgi:U3 small nucleolar RNA-associated protein 25